MKGGILKRIMARNLVKEKEADLPPLDSDIKKSNEIVNTDGEKVIVVTENQVLLNHLNFIISQQKELLEKVLEGFKQVGVKFDDTKKE